MRPVLVCAFLGTFVTPLVSEQTPVFRSRVEVVAVDVSVVDDQGLPIETLRPEDFRLLVDGQSRTIVSAEYIAVRASASQGAESAVSSSTSHFASNEGVPPGRIVLIAVDRRSIRRTEGGAVLRAAAEFVDELDRSDRVAAVGVEDGTSLEFTADHAAVKQKLAALRGSAEPPPNVGQHTLGLIEALAISDGELMRLDQAVQRECGGKLGRFSRTEALAAGRNPCPIHVEQQSRAMAQRIRTEARQSVAALTALIARLADIDGPKTMVLLSEGLVAEPRHVDFMTVATAAQRARVSLYVLHAEPPTFEASDASLSPTAREDFNLRADGLSRLAGTTGGAFFPLIGTGSRPFDRILREMSGYYLLGFEPAASDRDGKPHRIAVSVRTPGAFVRARSAFQTPPVRDRAATTEERLVQLLRRPRLSTELPLRLAAYRARGDAAGRVRTTITVETGRPVDTTFGFVLVDERGVVATSAVHRTGTGRYSFEATLDRTRYVLRAAGIESTGRTGSVEHPLDLRLPETGEPHTSDLVLAEKVAGESRTIVAQTSADTLVASLEIYTSSGVAPPAVDVAVADEAGVVKQRVKANVSSTGGRWISNATVDLATLPAGTYIVSAATDSVRVSRSFVLTR